VLHTDLSQHYFNQITYNAPMDITLLLLGVFKHIMPILILGNYCLKITPVAVW